MNDTDLIIIDGRIKAALDKKSNDGSGCAGPALIFVVLWIWFHLCPLLEKIKARLDKLDPPQVEAQK